MGKFLLELLVEEIPSRFQLNAIEEFSELMQNGLAARNIEYSDVQSFISPRRIIFSANIAEHTKEFVEEKKGPQTTANQDVIDKFLRANNVTRADCVEKTVNKKDFLFAQIKHAQQNTLDLLPELIKEAIKKISWKKSMHWNKYSFNFVRPLRNILVIFDENPLHMCLDEIDLESTDYTFGHRLLAPQKIHPKSIEEYLEQTRKAFILVDQKVRRQKILDAFTNLESQYGFKIDIREDLLEEVVGLVEYPVVLVGKIPDKFMQLPEEVIITPLRVHQRYFPTKIDGKLAPFFVFVADNAATDGGKTIIRGNERVLNARLEDALFFFETDKKNPLESYLEKLKKVTFQEKLGSVFDRTVRLEKLCDVVCNNVQLPNEDAKSLCPLLRRTAHLSKCDLVTSMVGEFPEVQGIMGGYYAQWQGEAPKVCSAIREQHMTASEVSSTFSALFFIMDRLDFITSFFAIGKEPTGSKDPFALRRAAINILQTIKKFELNISLIPIVETAFANLNLKDADENVPRKVEEFIRDRLKIILKNQSTNFEMIDELMKSKDNVITVFQKSEILDKNAGALKQLMECCKRAKNIVQENEDAFVDDSLLEEDAEKKLHTALKTFEQTNHDCKNIAENFQQNINDARKLVEVVSEFFEKILVNTEDQNLRKNRMNLLTKFLSAIHFKLF